MYVDFKGSSTTQPHLNSGFHLPPTSSPTILEFRQLRDINCGTLNHPKPCDMTSTAIAFLFFGIFAVYFGIAYLCLRDTNHSINSSSNKYQSS